MGCFFQKCQFSKITTTCMCRVSRQFTLLGTSNVARDYNTLLCNRFHWLVIILRSTEDSGCEISTLVLETKTPKGLFLISSWGNNKEIVSIVLVLTIWKQTTHATGQLSGFTMKVAHSRTDIALGSHGYSGYYFLYVSSAYCTYSGNEVSSLIWNVVGGYKKNSLDWSIHSYI